MTMWRELIVAVLLFLGVGIVLLCCLGVLVMRGAFNRLHYLGPASIIAPLAIAAAVVFNEALSASGIKAILVALTLLVISPILTHATARAAYIRKFGGLKLRGDDDEKSEAL